jgi:glutamyl-tRNA synthetase
MRRAQQALGRAPRYAGTCAHLTPAQVAERLERGERPAWRFRIPASGSVEFNDLVRGRQVFATADMGDFIIRRADASYSFLFSNALDDALMEVTHVLRGEDHLSNTPRQWLLLQALALPAPHYGHIPLILGQDATPLAKRLGSASLAELRHQGYLPGAILNYLARLGHQYPDNDFHDLQGLAQGFTLEHLGRAPARFDPQQLLYWQRQAVLNLGNDALWAWIGLEVDSLVPEAQRGVFINAVRDNVRFPAEAQEWARVLFSDEPLALGAEQRAVLRQAGGEFFKHALKALTQYPSDFAAMVQQLKREAGVQGRALFQPLRVALTGQTDGPELARLIPLMGVERAQRRLQRAQQLEALSNAQDLQ